MKVCNTHTTIGGKISIATTILGVCVILVGLVVDMPRGNIAWANNATTSVTVLNTPPQWNSAYGDAQEAVGSSTTTPTNVLQAVNWIANAYDSSGDNYYLLICKTSGAPTPVDSGAPECNGGAGNRWARSAATASNATSTAATTTTEGSGSQFLAEFNDWYAFICDNASVTASCQPTYKTGSGTTSSPFVVNHRPTFSLYGNNTPVNPAGTIEWYATTTDSDTYEGTATDTVKLFVCKLADFTGTACGAVDGHGLLVALGGQQAVNSSYTINNVAPTILAASVSLLDTDLTGPLTLTGIAAETPGFSVRYTISDQNSCETTTAGSEIIFGLTNVYRSGVTGAFCDQSDHYNANNCYPGAAATTSIAWGVSCTASSTSCTGPDDSDVIWDCTFPLWYVADATDGTGGPATDPTYWNENWLASVQAADDDFSTSSLVEASSGNDLTSFLAYSVSTTTIAYGGLQPGNDTGTVGDTTLDRTDVLASGNVGLDETLYGEDMCPGFPAPCSGLPGDTIFVANQRYASSSISYASAVSLLANPGATFLINIPKSTTTLTQSTKTTHWGIAVPGAITVSGDYLGQNTILGVTSDRTYW
ncbi:MAG: hypothetical protein UY04_C0019G0010 [Parcubacteria group bacterium GW2011_GWA2_47_7]|nr:MAG: hypothetical protein UY04_C0019G0010 [Parcubacteria group bacterium GW2011_GWA2_47_7]